MKRFMILVGMLLFPVMARAQNIVTTQSVTLSGANGDTLFNKDTLIYSIDFSKMPQRFLNARYELVTPLQLHFRVDTGSVISARPGIDIKYRRKYLPSQVRQGAPDTVVFQGWATDTWKTWIDSIRSVNKAVDTTVFVNGFAPQIDIAIMIPDTAGVVLPCTTRVLNIGVTY